MIAWCFPTTMAFVELFSAEIAVEPSRGIRLSVLVVVLQLFFDSLSAQWTRARVPFLQFLGASASVDLLAFDKAELRFIDGEDKGLIAASRHV